MIKSVKIKNFQSHSQSVLEFHPGVNAIVGRSDSGKSAVLRAGRWVLENRPTGDSFRSKWGGDTEVDVELKPGGMIRRRRSKQNNDYQVGEVSLKAVGVTVPEVVQNAVDMDEINTQRQLSAPFLVSDSPAEIARTLNRIASLETIDKAMTNIDSRLREDKGRLVAAGRTKVSLQGRIAVLEWVDEASGALAEAEITERQMEATRTKIAAAAALVNTIIDLNVKLAGFAGLDEAVADIDVMIMDELAVNEVRENAHILKILIDNVVRTSRKLEVLPPEDAVNSLLRVSVPWEEVRVRKAGLELLIDYVSDKTKRITALSDEIESLEKQMPTVCPTCGQEMPRCQEQPSQTRSQKARH